MEEVKIQIKRTKGKADADIPLPRYMTKGSSGMDTHAAVERDVIIMPGERKRIPTGIAIAVPMGYEVQIRPRSGLAFKNGISLANSPGTIDADYRGEIGIMIINLGTEPFTIRRGDRIAQMIINRVYHASLELTEEMDTTERNSGGFGHTGR